MDLRVLTLLTMFFFGVNGDCLSSMHICVNTFLEKLFAYETINETICQDWDDYVECVVSSECFASLKNRPLISMVVTNILNNRFDCQSYLADIRNGSDDADFRKGLTDSEKDCFNGFVKCFLTFVEEMFNLLRNGDVKIFLCVDLAGFGQCLFKQDCISMENWTNPLVDFQSLATDNIDCPSFLTNLSTLYVFETDEEYSDKEKDCIFGIKTCTYTVVEQWLFYISNHDVDSCIVLDEYVKCIFSQNCEIDEVVKQVIIDRFNDKFEKDFSCPFTLVELMNRYDQESEKDVDYYDKNDNDEL